ncbi:MAG: hypothetical protein JSW27_23950 [Phycisphaerales bacterium]|nr:MAG: hypothetical protein JSW27_23950 [Phycisphaerales bacterium]
MSTRTLLIISIAMLSLPTTLYARESAPLGNRPAPAEVLLAPPESAWEMEVFAFEYQEAGQLAETLQVLVPRHEATIAVDQVANHLIVATSPDWMKQIERVIRELDVPPVDEANAAQMLYRIYMLELPSEHENLRPFSLVLEGTSLLRATELLDAVQDVDMQIDSLEHEPEDARWQKWELVIEGRAASNESIKRMLEKIPESQMKVLRWNDERLAPPPVQIAPLPNELNKHLRQLLGADIRTVGYWFGNLSVPGKARAPIGPWLFDMEVDRSTQKDQVELEIAVTDLLPSGDMWEILGNSVRSHIMKPVIIGYNRESDGTRTMGALVIVPQESPLP